MIGLVFGIVIGLWCLLGWYVSRRLITRRTRLLSRRLLFVPLFWVVWLIGPIADDIVGRRIFDEECARLPPVKYFGPVHVGAGAFFDESGKRRWKSDREFTRIRVETREWERIFRWDRVESRTATFPIVITRIETTIRQVSSNAALISTVTLWSSGGWTRRIYGSSIPSSWTCHSPGNWPRDEDTIIF